MMILSHPDTFRATWVHHTSMYPLLLFAYSPQHAEYSPGAIRRYDARNLAQDQENRRPNSDELNVAFSQTGNQEAAYYDANRYPPQNSTHNVVLKSPVRNEFNTDPLYTSVRREDPRNGQLYSQPQVGSYNITDSRGAQGGTNPVLNKSFSSIDSNRGVNGINYNQVNEQWKNPGKSPKLQPSRKDRWADAGERNASNPPVQPDTVRLVKPTSGTVQGTRMVRKQSSRNARTGNEHPGAGSGMVALYHTSNYNHENVPGRADQPQVELIGGDRVINQQENRPNRDERTVGQPPKGGQIPASLRGQYIEEIAESRTPHTRDDLLQVRCNLWFEERF